MNTKDLAFYLCNIGFNVVPCCDKRPYIPLGSADPYLYNHLKINRLGCERLLQAIENIELDKKEYNIGILLGEIKEGRYQGYYSWAIDIDDPENIEILNINNSKCIEKGVWFEKSRKGFHLYGISKEKAISEKNHDLKLELFGENSFIVVYGNFEQELYELQSKEINLAYQGFKQDIAKTKGITATEKKPLSKVKIGVKHGERNTSCFSLAVDYRNKGLSIEEATSLIMTWNKNNRPPLHDREIINCIKSAYSKVKTNETEALADKQEIQNHSLQDVYTILRKWLYIQDEKRIDVLLATAISNQIPGTPLWIFFVGNSGDTKSELISALTVLPNTIKVDMLTPNTLASGRKDAHDLGGELQNSSNILIFPDLAALTSLNKDAKREIWSQWRNLYDGFINKRTGSGVNKAYEGCHVTVIAGATQAIRDEYHIHQQLGTRELLYDTESEAKHNRDKMKAAWENENYEKQMREEIRNAIYGFWTNHKYQEKEIPPDIEEFLYKEADRLALLRASAMTDWKYNELTNDAYPEVPTRLIKQFKRLFVSLKNLDDNYTDERAKQIITHIVNSSGSKVRQKIIAVFKQDIDKEWTISKLQEVLKIGRSSLKTELEILWNLGSINKEIKKENWGGYVTDDNGHEIIRGGRWEEVAYYKAVKHEPQQPLPVKKEEGQ